MIKVECCTLGDYRVSLTGAAQNGLSSIASRKVWSLSDTLEEVIERGLVEMGCTLDLKGS